MKNALIFMLLFLILDSLSAEEPSLQEEEVNNINWDEIKFEFYISPGIIADVGVGTIQRFELEKCYQEATIILHADLFPHVWEEDVEEFYKIYFWGAKFKEAYFYKADYSGFNWFFNVGFQSTFIDIYNSTWIGFPDLAVGCSYSWKLKNDHYFRISTDAGLKLIITNLYFSYVW